MTDELSRDEARAWIHRNWKTMTPDKRKEVLKRYWKKYGGTKEEDTKGAEEDPPSVKAAKKVFAGHISNKQSKML